MIPRQRLVDTGEHRVPVDQQVENDDRCDQKQRRKVDQRNAAVPDRCHDRAREGCPVLRELVVQPVQRALKRRKVRSEPAAGHLFYRLPAPLHFVRQRRRQLAELIDEDRNQQHQSQRDEDGDHADDEDSRQDTIEAESLQPVGDGTEEVGNHDSGDKRQQDVLQQCNRADEERERRQPEPKLLLGPHDFAPICAAARSGRRVLRIHSQPYAEAKP